MSFWTDLFTGGEAAYDELTGQTSSSQLSNAPGASSWLSGLGGDIASGIEGSLVAFLHDLWTVIVAPLAIITGIGLIILAFVLFFKEEIAGAAAMAGELGMLA